MKTYISLFSSAGVGCYGFKQAGFECVATNELIKRRLDIQKYNNKCKYDSGYICGDITSQATKNALFNEVELWRKQEGLKRLDVVIATPPCQGMSVANHKKTDAEILRNSLVIESINIIKKLKPRFFIFEKLHYITIKFIYTKSFFILSYTIFLFRKYQKVCKNDF